MSKIKIEAFLSVPPCSGGIALSRLLGEIEKEFAGKVEITVHRGPVPEMEELKLSATPALVIGNLVRITGVCPDRETMVAALRECGLN
ncbi:hypothetical protein [Desulfotomaculum copahuensis]|uniref:Thioredoxin-like fold domain-containing protein n=1 Tax=Desulfotomaculum copahuensis TaxID=1838280 RepID=A0A1B7LIJ1_9FIRM|nr:hypothetical protein [Desulfotomaculum copahuensis]OAT86136.1 hypothetical protein A6M21_04280 [Desulfotomaculum copahuensis]